MKIYHINAEKLILGDQGHFNDNSIHNTFNFYDCNIDLQGNLNDLASLLKRKGATEEADVLEDAAKALTEAENLKTPEEVKKKGIANKLKRIAEDLENENTTLHKAVKTINSAVKVAQDIGNIYNGFAQWVGLPQVPKLFLKKE